MSTSEGEKFRDSNYSKSGTRSSNSLKPKLPRKSSGQSLKRRNSQKRKATDRQNKPVETNYTTGRRIRRPRGVHLDFDDLLGLATGSNDDEAFARKLDSQISSLRTQVEVNKIYINKLKQETAKGIDMFRPSKGYRLRTNPTKVINSQTWT